MLLYRGVFVNSHRCQLCLQEDENTEHVFFRCDFALTVWNWLVSWSGLMSTAPIDFNSFTACADTFNSEPKKFKLLLSLGYSTLWLIWKERNDRFFGKRIKKPMQLADDIQLHSFNWIKNRGKSYKRPWNEWCASPIG
ncbi:hypothetical protein LXL04_022612 [Taraxacum kok-saghyz]